jgi:hypothetical protein
LAEVITAMPHVLQNAASDVIEVLHFEQNAISFLPD